jgi:hypothetical protein
VFASLFAKVLAALNVLAADVTALIGVSTALGGVSLSACADLFAKLILVSP